MSKKQLAATAAMVLGALVATLSQCQDESPVAPRTGATTVDAGAR